MVLDQHRFTYDPAKDGSTDDFIKRIAKVMESMTKQSFDARPLPPNPRIMTIPPEASVHKDIGLWKDTCPVCRPLVKDLHLLSSASPDILQDKNIYIQWHPSFSQLSSALATEEQGQLADAPDRANSQKGEHGNASEKIQEIDELDSTTKHLSPLGYNENESKGSEKNNRVGECNGPVPCPFCAYFACLMFDDPMYTFSVGPGYDSLNSEMKCCCSKSLAKSERVAKVAKTFKSYVELYGPDARIGFLIQPVDFDLVDRGFGKLRFQAHTRSPSIPEEALRTILGTRRELVLEVYKVQGKFSKSKEGSANFKKGGCPNTLLISSTSLLQPIQHRGIKQARPGFPIASQITRTVIHPRRTSSLLESSKSWISKPFVSYLATA